MWVVCPVAFLFCAYAGTCFVAFVNEMAFVLHSSCLLSCQTGQCSLLVVSDRNSCSFASVKFAVNIAATTSVAVAAACFYLIMSNRLPRNQVSAGQPPMSSNNCSNISAIPRTICTTNTAALAPGCPRTLTVHWFWGWCRRWCRRRGDSGNRARCSSWCGSGRRCWRSGG